RLARPPRWGVPVRAGASMWQDVPGGTVRTPVRVRGSVALARVRWRVEPTGPLAWLRGARPLFGVVLTDFRLRFGPSWAPPAGG
ncbi:hypothetical protein J7S33_04365, partial [Saccharothrix algeriensis]